MNKVCDETLPYSLGGLLYTPAVNTSISDKIISKAYNCLMSVSFCLEDAIMDDAIDEAEKTLAKTIHKLSSAADKGCEIPRLFIRVRSPEQLERVQTMLGKDERVLTGYILPKFDISNGEKYLDIIGGINEKRKEKLFVMPILESRFIAEKNGRVENLCKVKELLDKHREYVLNVRVGGNDFCNLYGLRRAVNQTIYDMGVIRDILVDILNVFASDYVVSGPVWEYFGDDTNYDWCRGLKKELELDRLNGFIGKTAIHPAQLPVIYDAYKVTQSDYNDALKILCWSSDNLGVGKSNNGSRMNEVKCHTKWAQRIKALGDIYGTKKDIY